MPVAGGPTSGWGPYLWLGAVPVAGGPTYLGLGLRSAASWNNLSGYCRGVAVQLEMEIHHEQMTLGYRWLIWGTWPAPWRCITLSE